MPMAFVPFGRTVMNENASIPALGTMAGAIQVIAPAGYVDEVIALIMA